MKQKNTTLSEQFQNQISKYVLLVGIRIEDVEKDQIYK